MNIRMSSPSCYTLTTVALWMWALTGLAQSCTNPLTLCAETVGSNQAVFSDSAPLQFGCLDVQNTFFYEFTTNTNTTNVGTATIDVSGINCPGALVSDTVFAAVIAFDQADPCNPATWSLLTACESDTLGFTIETPDLTTSTSYFFVLGTNQDPASIDCEMLVDISGPAVDIDACCDANINLGDSHQFSVFGGEAIPGYTWDPPSWLDNFASDSPTSFPEETITYTVYGTIGDCIASDEVTLFVLPPIAPTNAISPNSDGFNDTWEIGGVSRFENASVTVFDRWGQQVFRSIGYTENWDGTNNGNFLPTATYYWVIELNSQDVNIAPLTGFITIVH